MIKKKRINNEVIRYVHKLNYHWVVVTDLGRALNTSPNTIIKYTTPLKNETWQVQVDSNKAIAVRVDVLIKTINDIKASNKWHLKTTKNPRLHNAFSEALAFLKELSSSNDSANQEEESSTEKIEQETKEDVVTPIDFNFMGHTIRFVGTASKFEWVASDPVAALHPDAERSSYSKYLEKVDNEWKGKKKIPTLGGIQEVTTLYEPGLYQLTARSNSPVAREFQVWLFEDVLPSIRRKGAYIAPGTIYVNKLLPPIEKGTLTNAEKFAQFITASLNTTNLPIQVKNLCLARALREAFPERKEFSILSEALSCQDLLTCGKEIIFRTYHSTSNLAIVYSSKHHLSSVIDKGIIHKALVKSELVEKGADGKLIPTNLGKQYCIVGWSHNEGNTLDPAIHWCQEVLSVIGIIHK